MTEPTVDDLVVGLGAFAAVSPDGAVPAPRHRVSGQALAADLIPVLDRAALASAIRRGGRLETARR